MGSSKGKTRAVCLVRSSINIDEVLLVPHIVRPGETLSSNGVDRKIGGKGANVSAAIGLGLDVDDGSEEDLGKAVFLAGSIGRDEWLLEELRERGVRTSSVVVRDDVKTGTAYIQVAEDGENSIILLKGANFASEPSLDDPFALFSRIASQAGGSPVTHLVLQNEIPLAVTKATLEYASSRACISIFNPSPMLSGKELGEFPWNKLDVLLVNEGEARDLLEAFGSSQEVELQGARVLEALCEMEELREVPWIVMTRGAQGVAAAILSSSKNKKEVLEVPAGKPRVVRDTTGAGDTFAGYLVASLMREVGDAEELKKGKVGLEKAKEVLELASWAAALAVETSGAMVSIPRREDVVKRMREGH